MENTTEVEYISIYDKPKRVRLGRPNTSKLTDEETRLRKRDNAKKLYKENYAYRRLQQALYYERKKEGASNELSNICFCPSGFKVIRYSRNT